MLRFGLLICVCLFFLGCALLFAFGSAGSPCFEICVLIAFWTLLYMVAHMNHTVHDNMMPNGQFQILSSDSQINSLSPINSATSRFDF